MAAEGGDFEVWSVGFVHLHSMGVIWAGAWI
jgi:hypothetical protein